MKLLLQQSKMFPPKLVSKLRQCSKCKSQRWSRSCYPFAISLLLRWDCHHKIKTSSLPTKFWRIYLLISFKKWICISGAHTHSPVQPEGSAGLHCLYETHSAKQSWQWAVLLISHVCTNTAFLRGRFPAFKVGNDCTCDHCRCALGEFGYHKLRPNWTTLCMQCTESQGRGKIPFYHYCSKDLRSSQGQ